MRCYCDRHGLRCPAIASGPPTPAGERAARALYVSLPRDRRDAVWADAHAVNELASADANSLLLEVAGPGHRPPPDVPAGPAVALWYFVHRPDVFQEVFHRYRSCTTGTWRVGRTLPHLPTDRLDARADELAAAVAGSYSAGSHGSRAAVEAYPVADGYVFELHVSERERRLTAFSRAGRPVVAAVHPAATLVFAYEASSGLVRLYSRLRSRTRTDELLRVFGRVALAQPVEPLVRPFDLDRLKRPLLLAPDAPDMESVRVKAMSLAYPPHLARRRLTLDTPAGDQPQAVYDLIRTHVPADLLESMTVTHAEFLIGLRSPAGGRSLTARVWADRSTLGYGAFGRRVHACLRLWGLAHV